MLGLTPLVVGAERYEAREASGQMQCSLEKYSVAGEL